MRSIALVNSTLRPGGAEQVMVHLARGLADRGLAVSVICLAEKGTLAEDVEDAGVPVISLNSTRGYDLKAIVHLRRLFREREVDVIHVHDLTSMMYAVCGNLLGHIAPVVFTAHGALYNDIHRPRLRYRLTSQRLEAMTAVSALAGNRHAQYLNWSHGIDIVANGVPDQTIDAPTGRDVRKRLNVASNAFVFLVIGNAKPEKGYDVLLNAAARVKERVGDHPFIVLVAGAMPNDRYGNSMRHLQQHLRLTDTFRFLGFQSDVQRLYSAADAFVLSSRSEGLPMVILEAMMAGLPVVATRVGGVPDAVGDCGLLVDPEEPEALAGAMQHLTGDPALTADLGRRARERALRHYSLDRMVDRYIEVYERVAARHVQRKAR